MKRSVLLILLIAAAACVTTSVPQKPAAPPALKAPIAAMVNGQPITEKDLEAKLGATYIVKQQEEYSLKHDALTGMIFQKLQEAEAKKEGITVEALYKKKVQDQAADPTEEQINNFYTQNKARMNANEADAKKQIKDYLRSQNQGEKEDAFRKELMAAAKVDIMLRPPRIEMPKGNAPVKGPAGAPIQIVEYTDFQCPYCGRVQDTLAKVFDTYKDKVALTFRDFPLEFHQNSRGAHTAAHCAGEQGKFWETHDVLFKNQSQLSSDDLKKYAETLKLDMAKFNACIEAKKYEKDITASIQEGQALGVTGTPSFFINGRPLKGAVPYDQFKQVIDEELTFAAQGSGH